MALEFEDKQYAHATQNQKHSVIASFLVRHKLAKNEASADKIIALGGILIMMVALCLFYLAYMNANIKESVYNFPNELISRFPTNLQLSIQKVLYAKR